MYQDMKAFRLWKGVDYGVLREVALNQVRKNKEELNRAMLLTFSARQLLTPRFCRTLPQIMKFFRDFDARDPSPEQIAMKHFVSCAHPHSLYGQPVDNASVRALLPLVEASLEYQCGLDLHKVQDMQQLERGIADPQAPVHMDLRNCALTYLPVPQPAPPISAIPFEKQRSFRDLLRTLFPW